MSGQVFFTASCPMVVFRCKDTKFFLEIQIFRHVYRTKRIEICLIDIFNLFPFPSSFPLSLEKWDLLGTC